MIRFTLPLLALTLTWSVNASLSGEHEWIPKREGDSRGPCPALNTLCNHGYISRNGTDVPVDLLARACEDVFSVSVGTINFIISETVSQGVQYGATPDGTATLTMSDLYAAEHDSSFVRADEFFEPQAQFNPSLLEEFLSINPESGFLTPENISAYQTIRINHSRRNVPNHVPHNSSEQRMIQLAAEKVFILLIGNDDLLQTVSKESLHEFFTYERLPEGYTSRQERGLEPVDLMTDFSGELVQRFLGDIATAVEAPLTYVPPSETSDARAAGVFVPLASIVTCSSILWLLSSFT